MQADKIAKFVTKDEEGFVLFIDTSDKDITCANVKVLSISMWVGNDAEDCGDLAVNWSMEGLRNDETARTAGNLLLRNMHSNDDVTKVMGAFYWEHAFDAQLRALLADCGFSATAADDVSGSEWGMQDEGRASYDAYLLADEVRAAMRCTV